MGGRKDLGGGEQAHGGGIQQVPAAYLQEQAAAVQGGHHVPPGQDHGGYPGETRSTVTQAAGAKHSCSLSVDATCCTYGRTGPYCVQLVRTSCLVCG